MKVRYPNQCSKCRFYTIGANPSNPPRKSCGYKHSHTGDHTISQTCGVFETKDKDKQMKTNENRSKKYLTIDELSTFLNISRGTLAKMRMNPENRKKGETIEFIPFIKIGKKKVLYEAKDVYEYLSKNKIKE